MTKKYIVLVTNPTGTVRFYGPFSLRPHTSMEVGMTLDEINQARSAGFIVELNPDKYKRPSCFGDVSVYYAADHSDCITCLDFGDCKEHVKDSKEENDSCVTESSDNIQDITISAAMTDELCVEEPPDCFSVEFDDYEDCDDCFWNYECKNSMIELELLDKNPDMDEGVEVILVNKNPDMDNGIKIAITNIDPDADPTDSENDFITENITNVNDD